MTSARVSVIHRALIAALVTTYLGAGIAGFFADFDTTTDRALWVSFLVGGAGLIVLGAVVRNAPPRVSVALLSIGAIAGSIPLLWTILVPIAAAALVAMTFSLARHAPAA